MAVEGTLLRFMPLCGQDDVQSHGCMEQQMNTAAREVTAQQYLQDILKWRAQQRSSDKFGYLAPTKGPENLQEPHIDIGRYRYDARINSTWMIIYSDYRT